MVLLKFKNKKKNDNLTFYTTNLFHLILLNNFISMEKKEKFRDLEKCKKIKQKIK